MSGYLGKYRLDARLGGGGMAEVFLGSSVGAEGFSRRVAIKRVLPGYSDNPQFAKMFVDEARISSRLAHPNIVSVLDFDRDAEGRLYLVMELVDGRDLDALASSGPLPIPLIIYVIGEVLRGLGHAHDLPADEVPMDMGQTIQSMRGIVHRDVSPHNVLLSWEGSVKVSDFGIAKARSASSATASVFIKGKPAYMSPEQANGESLDGRSDLFAVGVMLWELLCSRRLFVGEDTRATLAAVLFGQIPRPRSLRPDVPKDLERVVMKLLERERNARYPTAEAAIHDLLECKDAPRDGRELLRRTLTERFPDKAPVRHSSLRSRAAGSTPQSVDVPSHARETIAGVAAEGGTGPATPAAAMPSMAMRNMATGTMQPSALIPKPRKNLLAIGLVGGGIVVLAIVGIIVAATSGSKDPSVAGPGSVAPVGEVADAGTVATAPPPADAAPVGVPTPPADAPPAVPPPDAKGQKVEPASTTAQPAGKRGSLRVTAFPALTVYVDKKKIHDTPVTLNLPVGKHSLRLVNRDVGHDETVTIVIKENQTTTINRE